MADDGIAELLDEVERKYCSPKTTPTPSATRVVSKETVSKTSHHHGNRKPRAAVSATSCRTPTTTVKISNDVIKNDIITGEEEEEDLDKIISEIINEPGAPPGKRGKRIKPTMSIPSPPDKRCSPVLLAGVSTSLGLSDPITRRACDRLRCTSCDFQVTSFDHSAWHSRSDYLFFRNNMPDRDKLRKNLVSRKGWRAYACQCSWRSVSGVEEVGGGGGGEVVRGGRRGREISDTAPVLKWVCGKHR